MSAKADKPGFCKRICYPETIRISGMIVAVAVDLAEVIFEPRQKILKAKLRLHCSRFELFRWGPILRRFQLCVAKQKLNTL